MWISWGFRWFAYLERERVGDGHRRSSTVGGRWRPAQQLEPLRQPNTKDLVRGLSANALSLDPPRVWGCDMRGSVVLTVEGCSAVARELPFDRGRLSV